MEVLELIEEALDQVAFAVEREITVTCRLAIRLGRDDHGVIPRWVSVSTKGSAS